MPSSITEGPESCYTLQPRLADECFDINSFVKIVLDKIFENLKIENSRRQSKQSASKAIIINSEFMKSEDKIQICQQHCYAKGKKLNTDLPYVLGQSLNVDVRGTNRRNPSVMETEGTGSRTQNSKDHKNSSPWIHFTDPIENRRRQPLPETLDYTYNGMGPFKPSIWTFDIMSRLEFVLTFTAAGPRGITFLGNGRTY